MIVRAIYNAVWPVLFTLSCPWYLRRLIRRGNWRENFWQRFGYYPNSLIDQLKNHHVVWVHAVSVGEVNTALQLIRQLSHLLPDWKFVVSTTTTTGKEILRKRLPPGMISIYYPIDFLFSVKRALDAINPKGIIIMETEIWPNLIWQASHRNIPLFLANARLSQKSFVGYQRLGFLFRDLFSRFTWIFAQNSRDSQKLVLLGSRPDRIHVVGSMKFDAVSLDESPPEELAKIMETLGANHSRPTLIGGSTHAGEEKILAELFLKLKNQHPQLLLILVPRHFERAPEVARELQSLRLRFIRRSQLTPNNAHIHKEIDCLLVDTTGELRHLYRFATLVFVGKSLTAHGGQNPIEPAAAGKPIIMGPHMENFEQIANIFLEAGAAIQIKNQSELESAVADLLADPVRCANMGTIARQTVLANQGATAKTAQIIATTLKGLTAI